MFENDDHEYEYSVQLYLKLLGAVIVPAFLVIIVLYFRTFQSL